MQQVQSTDLDTNVKLPPMPAQGSSIQQQEQPKRNPFGQRKQTVSQQEKSSVSSQNKQVSVLKRNDGQSNLPTAEQHKRSKATEDIEADQTDEFPPHKLNEPPQQVNLRAQSDERSKMNIEKNKQNALDAAGRFGLDGDDDDDDEDDEYINSQMNYGSIHAGGAGINGAPQNDTVIIALEHMRMKDPNYQMQTIKTEQKVTVNLEDAVLQESKVQAILESLRNNLNASLYCDDWWDVTETGHFSTAIVYQVVKDEVLKVAFLRAQKMETIAVGVVQFYHLLAYEQSTIDTQTSVNTYLKNLLFQIHQNFLIMIRFTVSRIVSNQPSSWMEQLQSMVDSKLTQKGKNKVEIAQMLNICSTNAENILTNICKTNNRKHIFQLVEMWLDNLDNIPIDLIRDVLYNIEQFKDDAFILPEISNIRIQRPTVKTGFISPLKQKSPSSTRSTNKTGFTASAQKTNKTTQNQRSSTKQKNTPAKKAVGMSGQVYGAGAQSSGSLESDEGVKNGGGSSSSMTGKNPFAILKASAIADPATCVFPNNFTNLPKVYPPFLQPLEAGERYSLVLDLDETLIHNVDTGSDSFFLVRPGCVEFIQTMAKYYEIVIFTAALQEYADQVIDQIDVDKNIKYRLYRQHTSQNGPFLVKDLSLLGRKMNHTIIIDNISDNFVLQPDNGIFCSTWYDDMTDNFLSEITPLLSQIVEKQIDVRQALRKYRDQVLRQVVNGTSSPQISFS